MHKFQIGRCRLRKPHVEFGYRGPTGRGNGVPWEFRAGVLLGLEAVTANEHRRRVDESMIESYRRLPPTDMERRAAEASLRASILEEPW